MIATTGAVVLDGAGGDDILEDHDAEALLIGGAGDDRLISRNGRDALWGGNAFTYMWCEDDNGGNAMDEQEAGCSYYEGAP